MLRGRLGSRRNKIYEDIQYSCTIRFLDDTDPISVTYQKETKGQWLIDQVCRELNLAEKDYFGLRYVDAEKQRHWLDPWKPVYKQLKNVNPVVLCFRVKFYPTDPMKLKEELTRYFLFLQLRRDLHHGRLLCSPADSNMLAAYIIQSEVGDYDPQDHPPGYVAQFKMLPKQTTKQEEKIADIHKALASLVPRDAEAEFLKRACALDTYGVDPHPVKSKVDVLLMKKDQKGNQMYLGVTHLGIVTFQGNKRTHLFKWPQITKIAFEGKMFIVHVTISEGEENSLLVKRKKHACGFKCPTYSACKHLWKCAVEQQYFFTLQCATEAPKVTSGGGLFTRGSKFRFSGRCQKEVYLESQRLSRKEPIFTRSVSNPQLRSATSLPGRIKDTNVTEGGQGDIVVEPLNNQLTGALSLDQMAPPNGSVIHEECEELPDQTPVPVSSAPYDPIQSPSSEQLPPFPTVDLDSEIQQLQNELERCRTEQAEGGGDEEVDSGAVAAVEAESTVVVADSNQVTTSSPPPQQDDQPPSYEEHIQSSSSSNHVAATPNLVVDGDNEGRQRGLTCCKALTYIFFFLFFMMVVAVIGVLESELDVPVLNDLRQMPEVQHFKVLHYNPFKTTVLQKMGRWYKT